MRFLVAMLLLCTMVGCRDLRKLNTAEEESLERWVAEQNGEERFTAEYGAVIPPPKSNRGG